MLKTEAVTQALPERIQRVRRARAKRRLADELDEIALQTRTLSTASFVGCSLIVESRYGADGVRDLDLLIAKAQISLAAVEEEQAKK
jgi:uncharacterized protein with PIN domain